MEKEFASFIELESRIENILDLVNKLKEENQKLKEENNRLQNKYQTLSGNLSSNIKFDEVNDSENGDAKISIEHSETISKHVKSALAQLGQLRQIVMNDCQ